MSRNSWEDGNENKVQYLGRSGYTADCLIAIDAILNSGRLPERATIVSTPPHSRRERLDHLFLFWNWWHFPLVIIPSGFASGYSGAGQRGFSLAICMIRGKGIPIDGIFISEKTFALIDRGDIGDVNNPVYQQIRLDSELYTWPWPGWVLDEHEELLRREQLWRAFYWREIRSDWINEAVGDVDLYNPEVGTRLRLAINKLEKGDVAEWQNTGIQLRDAWIEFLRQLCLEQNIDVSDIRSDDVTGMLTKLRIRDRFKKLAKSAFDLSLEIQHDRNVSKSVTRTCVITSILSLQTFLELLVIKEKGLKTID